MNETPLPLVVWAMMQLGWPDASGKRCNATVNAVWSWPSTSSTAQPKARHFSAKGSRPSVSATGFRL